MFYYKIKIPIKENTRYISIIPIGDIHLGNPYSNLKKALEFRDYVLKTPNTYTIDMGDDMDIVTKESKGDIYEQQYSPYYQKQETIKFWKPVQEANKLFACPPNKNHTTSCSDAIGQILEKVLIRDEKEKEVTQQIQEKA